MFETLPSAPSFAVSFVSLVWQIGCLRAAIACDEKRILLTIDESTQINRVRKYLSAIGSEFLGELSDTVLQCALLGALLNLHK